MKALILASDGARVIEDLARPLLGAPMFERQLEWLQRAGVTEVTANHTATTSLPKDLHAEALERTGVAVSWIPTAEPLSAKRLASRAGWDEDEVVLVLEHAVLGDFDLKELHDEALRSGKDLTVVRDHARVHAMHLVGEKEKLEREAPEGAWLLELTTEKVCHELSEELLLRQKTGVEIRGSEIEPGIWRAHGAVVVEGAKLVPPCYLGAESLVSENAVVGPGAIIGQGSVVEAGAKIHHARVDDGVVVGQKILVEHACAKAGMIERHEGRRVVIEDELLLGEAHSDLGVVGRLAAASALIPIAPLAAVSSGAPRSWFRRLARVVQGNGQWMGVRTPEDEDRVVVDVLPLLVPPGAGEEEQKAATALYEAKKTPLMDLKLLAGLVLRAPRGQEGEE